MLLLANELPIHMEVLDADDSLISQTAATLHQLDGERAVVTLEPGRTVAGLFWGARVRLRMEDGEQGYEVLGTVLEHNLRLNRSAGNDVSHPEAHNPPAVRLRLWDCRTSLEQRLLPRRRVRFGLHYCPLEAAPAAAETDEINEVWQRAWCVDIGGGGLRLRAPRQATAPKRIALRFTLPTTNNGDDCVPGRTFCLQGRILRTEVVGRQSDTHEMAIRFERLTVEDGLALSRYFSASS